MTCTGGGLRPPALFLCPVRGTLHWHRRYTFPLPWPVSGESYSAHAGISPSIWTGNPAPWDYRCKLLRVRYPAKSAPSAKSAGVQNLHPNTRYNLCEQASQPV